MECTCIRHTEMPHTTRLFADFVYHFDRVSALYRHPPAAFAEAAAEIQFPAERRAALVSALRLHNGDSPSLSLLAQPGTVAVVTGQQVGLFSGPAYTIYKALTAAKLARQLTAAGRPAVPVFWLATEDHDFAEISRAWIFNPAHEPLPLEALGAAASGGPVGEIPLGQPPLEALRRGLADFPFAADVLPLVESAYSDGENFGSAFRRLLQRLLSSYGLLFLDPLLPAIRELAAPTLRAALNQAPQLTASLLERNRQLAEAGYHAQVHVEPQTPLFFLLENGQRVALKPNGRDYLAGARRVSPEELLDRPTHLSPNALLRPAVQDALLPTVAYIGGPAELAYLAQSEVVYRAVLGRMPVAAPRAAFTILDQRAAKLMRRYRLTLPGLFHGPDVLRERIAQILIPPPLAESLTEAKASTGQALERLSGDLTAFDPTLATALANSRAKIEFQLAKMEGKIGREAMRRDQRASRDAAFLSNLLYPHRHLQERFYSILPFLAKHGLDLLDTLYENVHLECPDHRILAI